MNYFAQSPEEYYRDETQATIDELWEDTAQIRKIKEQSFPFSDKYTEEEVWMSTVSDVSISTQKVIGNYIEIFFKDIDHPLNYRGQKYLYKDDGVNESVYLCYDKLNPLSLTPNTKLIKCNNKIKWIDKNNGTIYEEPIFIGWQLTSTNNRVSKEAIIEQRRLVCLVQGNEHTKDIVANQRFMLSNKKAFKVTQNDDMNLEHLDDEVPTLLTLYIEWSPLLPSDNEELRICDYYDVDYSIKINQDNIQQIAGFNGTLTATVFNNEDVVEMPISWRTSDSKIVSIDDKGNYQVVGKTGEKAIIEAYLTDNENVSSSIEISVVDDYLPEKIIIVSPMITELKEMDSVEFNCGVYIENEKQSDIVTCSASGANSNCYELEELIDGYKLTNIRMSKTPLTLTFTSGSCAPITLNVQLRSLL